MFAFHDQRFKDILLLVLGFFGVLWFFFDLKNHHPMSAIDLKMDEKAAIAMADSIFSGWDFHPEQLKKRASVNAENELINRIQATYGRQKYLSNNDSEDYQTLPLYTWSIEEFEVTKEDVITAVSFDLSKNGELVSFKASDEVIERQTPFNRKFLREAFGKQPGYNSQIEDSLITNLVDFQHLRTSPVSAYEILLVAGEEHQDNIVWRGADWYLKSSFWKRFNFKKDSLSFDDDGKFRYAKLFYTSTDTLMGVVPKVELSLLPAGSIREMSYTLESSLPPVEPTNVLWVNSAMGLFLIFVVWLLISFYLRIKARAIDTRPALIVAIITGFLVPLLAMLELSKEMAVSLDPDQIAGLFNRFLSFGVFGALTAISFFVATSVSDSITRQYWPDQLKTWDLVRQGMFRNKPVGWAIIRAICVGSVIAGLFSIMITVLPEAYIDGEVSFADNQYMFSPVANIIVTLLYSLAMIVLMFLIIGNQLYSITGKKWLIPISSAILFVIIDPVLVDINPMKYSIIVNASIGLVLGFFYIRFDFVTVALGYFIFANFLSTSKGWLVSQSPDAPIFVVFVITMGLLSVISLYFLITGDDKDQLPEYIPEYIEEQAREQRIQQELDIARNVQATFLPEETPDIEGFDASAICIAAQEAGGDYYDIICLDNDKVAIAIGDVSGKGIQAAFYMTFAKGVIHSLCNIFPSPKMMMYRANKLVNEHATRGTFISMIYGVLDIKEKTFTFLRAGHNPILYKKGNGKISWLQPPGVALGMSNGQAFNKVSQEEKIQLEAGDVLVLYTDGITEAQNDNDEFYDEKRLKRLIKREKTNSSKELRDLIIEDVRTFIGDCHQFDDMTLVVIKA